MCRHADVRQSEHATDGVEKKRKQYSASIKAVIERASGEGVRRTRAGQQGQRGG